MECDSRRGEKSLDATKVRMMKYKKVKIKQQVTTNYLKAIVAGLFCSGVVGSAQALDATDTSGATTTSKAKTTQKVHCYGINACKGKSDCHTANHSCSGQNACKGKGWKLISQEECKEKGGTLKADIKTKKEESKKS